MIERIADRSIDERTPRRPTRRSGRRAEKRDAIIEATIDVLVEEGYADLTTRRVAERVGLAQSTLMHHFPSRDELLAEAVVQLALRLATHATDQIDLTALRIPSRRDAVLDQAWATFTSPHGLAVGQLWLAAWTDPGLVRALGEMERRLSALIVGTAATLFPEESTNPRFVSLIDLVVTSICGLVSAIPISGRELVDQRWQALKPLLLLTVASVLDGPHEGGER